MGESEVTVARSSRLLEFDARDSLQFTGTVPLSGLATGASCVFQCPERLHGDAEWSRSPSPFIPLIRHHEWSSLESLPGRQACRRH